MKPKRDDESEDHYCRWKKSNKPPDPKPRDIKLRSYLVTYKNDEFKRGHTVTIIQEYSLYTGQIKLACKLFNPEGEGFWTTEIRSKDLSKVKTYLREFLKQFSEHEINPV